MRRGQNICPTDQEIGRNIRGQTITIPTITELEELIYSLVLYQYVDIDGMPYEEAIKIIGHKRVELRTVKSNYTKLKQVLDTYRFTPRG